MNRENLLFQIPGTESRFAIETAARVTRESPALVDVLKATGQVFAKKEYGWQEAILERRWLRYPREVGVQRFCSEEAFKTWLILKSLQIPAQYIIGENYHGSDMAHEMVLIQDGDKLWLVDWEEVTQPEFDGTKLRNDKEVICDKVHFLTDEQVLDRVKSLRSGDRFMDAISYRQNLFRRTSDEGQFEGYVKYNPDTQELRFSYCLLDPVGALPFYFVISLIPEEGQIVERRRFTIEDENGPRIFSQEGGNAYRDFRFIRDLSECRQECVLMSILYDRGVSISGDEYFGTDEERQKFQDLIDEALQKGGQGSEQAELVKSLYEGFKHDVNQKCADRWFNYSYFDLTMAMHTEEQGLKAYFHEQTQMDIEKAGETFFMIQLNNMGRFFNAQETTMCQQVLTNTLSEKTGIYYRAEPVSNDLLGYIQNHDGIRGAIWE